MALGCCNTKLLWVVCRTKSDFSNTVTQKGDVMTTPTDHRMWVYLFCCKKWVGYSFMLNVLLHSSTDFFFSPQFVFCFQASILTAAQSVIILCHPMSINVLYSKPLAAPYCTFPPLTLAIISNNHIQYLVPNNWGLRDNNVRCP